MSADVRAERFEYGVVHGGDRGGNSDVGLGVGRGVGQHGCAAQGGVRRGSQKGRALGQRADGEFSGDRTRLTYGKRALVGYEPAEMAEFKDVQCLGPGKPEGIGLLQRVA
ncbi:hypothetical protein [Streptomyces sp. NBC_01207]|uniref:hypothetical protein n=1 Tax=Streptomyces sp. NBC_01207 TaxID=2903772 RepID=UPI002E0DE9BA